MDDSLENFKSVKVGSKYSRFGKNKENKHRSKKHSRLCTGKSNVKVDLQPLKSKNERVTLILEDKGDSTSLPESPKSQKRVVKWRETRDFVSKYFVAQETDCLGNVGHNQKSTEDVEETADPQIDGINADTDVQDKLLQPIHRCLKMQHDLVSENDLESSKSEGNGQNVGQNELAAASDLLNNTNEYTLEFKKNLQCPVCFSIVKESAHATHVHNCFVAKFEHHDSGNTASCELCGKDISHMNSQRRVQHINRCLDAQQPKMQSEVAYLCPLCGVFLKTQTQKFTHLKRCSRKMGFEPLQVVEASNLLERQLAERKALGLPELALHKSKSSPKKKRFAVAPRSGADADIQIALALSASLENKEDGEMLHLQNTNQRKGRKKINRLPDCLQPLFLQTDVERMKLLEQKVAALMFPQTDENATFENFPSNNKDIEDKNSLWRRTCTLECSNFYISNLQDFITPEPLLSRNRLHNLESKKHAERPDELCLKNNLESTQMASGFYSSEVEGKAIDFQRSLAGDMKKLVGNVYLSDLAIISAEGTIPAHKLILSIRCPELLKDFGSVSEIDWFEISKSVVLAFLECIYTGTFSKDLTQDDEHHLLKLAYRYKVQDLFQTVNTSDEDSMLTRHGGNQDSNVLNEDEIETICQYSQSQRCLPEEERNRNSSLSILNDEIIDQLLDEDISSNTLQPDDKPELQKENSDVEILSDSRQISSPDLFSGNSNSDIPDLSSDEDLPNILSTNVVSSSPKKFTEIKNSTSGNLSHSFSTLKSPDGDHEIMVPHSTSTLLLEKGKVNISKRAQTLSLSPAIAVVLEDCDSSFDEVEPLAVITKSAKSLKQAMSPITLLDSPSEGSESKLSTLIKNKKRRLEDSTSNWKTPEPLAVRTKSARSLMQNMPLLSPPKGSESRLSPLISNKKRSCENSTSIWKTPKRSKTDQPSTSQTENNIDLADDIWAAFENECCVELHQESNAIMLQISKTSELPEQRKCNVDKLQLSDLKPQRVETPKSHFALAPPLITKTYDQVTPLPDYKKMITPELREALKNYGVRKLPRSKAVRLLHHIYELTHPLVDEDDHESASASKSPGMKGRTKKTKNKKSPKATKRKTSKFKKPTSESTTEKDCNAEELSSSLNSSSGEMPEESIGGDSVADDQLKKAIRKYILSDKELYEKTLLYEPVSVEELRQNLKHNEIKVTMQQLVNFLDEQCITFSLPRGEGYRKKQQLRNQRFRKRVASQISKESSN